MQIPTALCPLGEGESGACPKSKTPASSHAGVAALCAIEQRLSSHTFQFWEVPARAAARVGAAHVRRFEYCMRPSAPLLPSGACLKTKTVQAGRGGTHLDRTRDERGDGEGARLAEPAGRAVLYVCFYFQACLSGNVSACLARAPGGSKWRKQRDSAAKTAARVRPWNGAPGAVGRKAKLGPLHPLEKEPLPIMAPAGRDSAGPSWAKDASESGLFGGCSIRGRSYCGAVLFGHGSILRRFYLGPALFWGVSI